MKKNQENQGIGLAVVYEFFTRYVRRIYPDTHWKRTMKKNANKYFFQLITPSDIAFVISLLKNGMPVWNKKKVLFETDEMKKTKAKTLFSSGEGQKRSFGKTTWSQEGLKYYHKVERAWQEAYSNREQMCALINGWERWEPDEDLKKGKELLSTNWRLVDVNKKGKAGKEGSADENDDGWDNDDGYHSDKYNDVEDLPFKLDRGNLRKITGLENLSGNDDSFSSDESEEDEKGKGEDEIKDSPGKIGDHEKEEKDERVVTVERRNKRRNK